MARSRGYAKGTAEIKQPDEKVPNPTSVQSQNSADGMGRSRGHAKGAEANRPDKKHVNPTSVNSHNSAADRGYAKGAAQMMPGSVDLFKLKST